MLVLHLSFTEKGMKSSQNYIAQKTKEFFFNFQGIDLKKN